MGRVGVGGRRGKRVTWVNESSMSLPKKIEHQLDTTKDSLLVVPTGKSTIGGSKSVSRRNSFANGNLKLKGQNNRFEYLVRVCMHAWVRGCMGACMGAYMGACGRAWVVRACMGAWVHVCVGAGVHGCMGVWLHAWVGACKRSCVRACMGAWVGACVRVCVRA